MCGTPDPLGHAGAEAGVAIVPSNAEGSVHADDDLHVAIVGAPVWTDAELRSVAHDLGHAAALARAYRRHDLNMFERLQGDFAFAIVDAKRRRTIAAIDRIGRRRMYYAGVPGGVVFGTTADGVRAHPAVSSDLSPQGIYNFLFFYMSPAPGTVYAGQKKLQAAQYLVCENGRVRTDYYWRMPYRETTTETPEALGAELRALLRDSVGRALAHDRPENIGAFLSGGLDSSTMVGFIEKIAPGRTSCFTIGFDIEGYDETGFARIAASHFGARHRPYYMTADDLTDAIDRIVDAYDEPYGNSSAVPTYVCARIAAENGVRTMIAGDGGDELFAGNERYVMYGVFDRYNALPKILRKGLIEPAVQALGCAMESDFTRRARNFIRFANVPRPERPMVANLYGESSADGVLEPSFLARVDTSEPMREVRAIIDRTATDSPVQRMMHVDLQRTLADNDLVKVRRMCETAGVDVVFPFLDDRVLEFAATIPESTLLPGGRLRGFYKEAFGDFLPRATIEKQKHGFGIPTMPWSRGIPALRDRIRDRLTSFARRGILRESYLNAMIGAVLGNREPDGRDHQLVSSAWDVMMLESWMIERRVG